MIKANYSDKEKVVQIISESFDSNPHINFLIKKDKKREQRISQIANYAFEVGMLRNGVHLTDDKEGVMIFFQKKKVRFSFKELMLKLKLVFKVIGVKRAWKINKFESAIQKFRPQNGNYIYVWFIGVSDNGRGSSAAWEMMRYIFELADRDRLPILCETTVEQVKKIYKRIGFKTYKKFKAEIASFNCWFMKRQPNLANSKI